MSVAAIGSIGTGDPQDCTGQGEVKISGCKDFNCTFDLNPDEYRPGERYYWALGLVNRIELMSTGEVTNATLDKDHTLQIRLECATNLEVEGQPENCARYPVWNASTFQWFPYFTSYGRKQFEGTYYRYFEGGDKPRLEECSDSSVNPGDSEFSYPGYDGLCMQYKTTEDVVFPMDEDHAIYGADLSIEGYVIYLGTFSLRANDKFPTDLSTAIGSPPRPLAHLPRMSFFGDTETAGLHGPLCAEGGMNDGRAGSPSVRDTGNAAAALDNTDYGGSYNPFSGAYSYDLFQAFPPSLPPSPPSPPPSPRNVVLKDPHLHLAHGGLADFRGRNGRLYNFFSAPGLSVNLKTEDATFPVRRPDGTTLTVDGSFLTEMHLVASVGGDKRKWANLSYWATELTENNWGWRIVRA